MTKETRDILDRMDSIADMFYQNQSKRGLELLPQLVADLTAIAPGIAPEYSKRFMNAIRCLMECMEQKDYVLLADILIYEVKEVLQEE